MNLHECLTEITPQLTLPECGPEPSLYDMINEYYAFHIENSVEAKLLTKAYVDEWAKEAVAKIVLDLSYDN